MADSTLSSVYSNVAILSTATAFAALNTLHKRNHAPPKYHVSFCDTSPAQSRLQGFDTSLRAPIVLAHSKVNNIDPACDVINLAIQAKEQDISRAKAMSSDQCLQARMINSQTNLLLQTPTRGPALPASPR